MIEIFRIEHKESGLGPFQHGKQEVLNKGIRSDIKCFEDIDHLPEVKRILKKYKDNIRFGFISKELVDKCIIDKTILEQYGFLIKNLYVEPVYISPKGTVLFININK